MSPALEAAHVPKFQKAYSATLESPQSWLSLLCPQNHMHAVQPEKRHLQCNNRNQRTSSKTNGIDWYRWTSRSSALLRRHLVFWTSRSSAAEYIWLCDALDWHRAKYTPRSYPDKKQMTSQQT